MLAAVSVFDTHNDLAYIMKSKPRAPRHTDARRLREGQVGAVFFAAYVARSYARKPGASAERAREMIATIKQDIVGRETETFAFATTADEVERARRAGKIAAMIGLEGGHAIENSLDRLREFHSAGVRYMTLTHTNTNGWADAAGDKAAHGGLSEFGRSVVAEMNRIGMIIDISHVADETFWDVLAASKAPVFASHSSCRALTPHRRNMTDEMIRAMAKAGGVIQINFACEYVGRKKSATLDDVVRHIDHAVRVGGIDAVGIGSDYDGIDCAPKGLEDTSKFPALEAALRARGYDEAAVGKIFFGNTMRLLRAVERVSKDGAAGRL